MSLAAAPTVFIIDPNEGSRSALGKLLQEAGRGVAAYDCAETFLARTSADHPGCLLLESQLPGAGDLHLMDELQRRGAGMPVIFLSAVSTVSTVVRVIKSGAFDFIAKPYDPHVLIAAVDAALRFDARRRRERSRAHSAAARLALLTPREREIMRYVIAGKMNKATAHDLRISVKTVEAHRSKVMHKMNVASVAELVQLGLELRLHDGSH